MEEFLSKIEKRIEVIEKWLEENGNNCKRKQAHLNSKSIERIYWHYGYMIALKDMVALMNRDESIKHHKQDIYN